jgi:hypothetical protein
MLIWNPETPEQNSLWFLKIPLDEQGILPASVHSDLVSRLYRAVETKDEKERQRLLTDHPYQFTPNHEKMAALHANATKLLALPPSEFAHNAQTYFSQSKPSISWQELGIQGIADYVSRLKESELKLLANQVKRIEKAPLLGLLQQFEHRALPKLMVEKLLELAVKQSDQTDLVCACLRACSQSPAMGLFTPFITEQLALPGVSLEFTLIVVTRYLSVITDESTLILALDALATQSDADGFARVMTNLAMQPGYSGIVMRVLSSSHLTPALANALSQLIQQQRHGERAEHS